MKASTKGSPEAARENLIRADGPPELVGSGKLEMKSIGTITLRWSEHGLVSIDFGDTLCSEETTINIPQKYKRALVALDRGDASKLEDVPVEIATTDFCWAVYRALRQIPAGSAWTYSTIANHIGRPRSSRAVGMANAKNPVPLVIPCHRVVRAGALLGGYAGGSDTKRKLLELEGVKFDGEHVLPHQLGLFSE